jgi:hypothetical protein
MIAPTVSRCRLKQCRHFNGWVKVPEPATGKSLPIPVCPAYPNGIPKAAFMDSGRPEQTLCQLASLPENALPADAVRFP